MCRYPTPNIPRGRVTLKDLKNRRQASPLSPEGSTPGPGPGPVSSPKVGGQVPSCQPERLLVESQVWWREKKEPK